MKTGSVISSGKMVGMNTMRSIIVPGSGIFYFMKLTVPGMYGENGFAWKYKKFPECPGTVLKKIL
jgi:hypothetical protein